MDSTISNIFIPNNELSRSSSFSSCSSSSFRSSSFSSYTHDTPLNSSNISHTHNFNGVPFSWEESPGIPKVYSKSYSSSSLEIPNKNMVILPLPPKTHLEGVTKKFEGLNRKKDESLETDPFVAALMNCSNDRRNGSVKVVSKSLSNRFGFLDGFIHSSCMRSCEVSDQSSILLPRSSGLSNRRSSSK